MSHQLIIMFFAISMMAMFTIGMETNNINTVAASKLMDEQEHKVILQVTKADSAEQLVVVSQVKNILKSLPKAKIEVVCHSQGLPLLVASQTKVAKHIKELIEQGVIFAACENTMERKKIRKEDLLPGVTTVPSAMAELILKQEAGWTYVKAGL